MKSLTINQIRVGDFAENKKAFTKADVFQFAEISGDYNSAHIDEDYAKTTRFKERIVHGLLTAGLISSLLGMELPGKGTLYLEQNLKFLAPVYFNQEITARVEVIEIIDNKKVLLKTTCRNPEGVLVISGNALVYPPR